MPSMRCVGYRQAWSMLDGDYSMTEFRERAVLPDNAERSLVDPYAEKQPPWEIYGGLAVVALVLAWWLL